MKSSKITTVFFDVGGTLLYVDWARVLEILSIKSLGVNQLLAAVKPGREEYERRLAAGPVRPYEYLDSCLQVAGFTASQEQLTDLWQKHLEKNLWRLVGHRVEETLQELLHKKFRLAVISNSEGKVKELLEETHLAHYFEIIIDSQLEGVSKPDKEIFLRGLARMKVTPEESLYVGDVVGVDMLGAKNAGMHAALIDPDALLDKAETSDFWVLRSIHELVEKLSAQE
jgi:HAD superfamily hydrolase (TIGR01662 family)